MEISLVEDEEYLYRRIPSVTIGSTELKPYSVINGMPKLSSQAFTDRSYKPSVDRACLRDNNPCLTKNLESDGVVQLLTREVRAIDSVIQNDPKGNPIISYKIDVIHRPVEADPEKGLKANPSHAQIEPNPAYQNQKVFRKLLERLAILAERRDWLVLPQEFRSSHDSV